MVDESVNTSEEGTPGRKMIRFAMRVADRVRRLFWRIRGTKIHGVMALAFDQDDNLVLVRQTYSFGWCLPGGGRRSSEDPVVAGLRELREEIGVTRWRSATWLGSLDRKLSGIPAEIDIIRVEGVEFVFKTNVEVEAVITVDPKSLPQDLNAWTVDLLEGAKGLVMRLEVSHQKGL